MNAADVILAVFAVLLALSLIPCLVRDHRRSLKASEDLKHPLGRHRLP